MIPLLLKNRALVVAIAITLLVLAGVGVYMKGRSDGVALTEAKVAQEKMEWERQVAELQARHREDVIAIVSQYDQTVSEYREEIENLTNNPKVVEKYINRYVPVETQCAIPQGFVELHDKAAEGQSLSNDPVNPGEITDKTLSQVGRTVAENYYQCNEIRARLEALQQVVKKYQEQQQELLQ
jgi:hypothetical protein